jgi:hypothetical protein
MTDSLREFQLALGKYLRDPAHEPSPPNLPPRRLRAYEELLFNNLSGFVDSCFPVCKRLTDDRVWKELCRSFLREWRSKSPYFHEIPQEFLNFLENSNWPESLPPWFSELASYEWVELHLDTQTSAVTNAPPQPSGLIAANDLIMNLAFNWPVHKIGPDFQPDQPVQTFLVVMRNKIHQIKFIEINAATSLLIDISQQEPLSREELIKRVGTALRCQSNDYFKDHANQIINDLIGYEILVQR